MFHTKRFKKVFRVSKVNFLKNNVSPDKLDIWQHSGPLFTPI